MKKLPNIITQKEFELMFAAVKKKRDSSYKRRPRLNKYMIAMLLGFESGMRISEVIGGVRTDGTEIPGLTADKVDSASIHITQGKGKKDRVVPRPKRLTEKARHSLPLNIKRRALQLFITALGQKVLGKRITFHTLRHGFITHLINQGRPLHEAQMLAGHSRLDTTGIYLHADPVKAIEGARDVF